MAILNYTTSIDAIKTIGEIQQILIKHGVKNIMIDAANGQPTALSFGIEINGELIGFRLPNNHQGVYKALCRDPKITGKLRTEEQAIRVSWRIVKDWVEAQMAIIEAGLATLLQVFLPYAVTNTGQTLYELSVDRGIHLLLPSP